MSQIEGEAFTFQRLLFIFGVILPVVYAILWAFEAAFEAVCNDSPRLYLTVLVTDLDVYVFVMSSTPVVHTNHKLDVNDDSVVFKSTQNVAHPGEYCIATVKAPVALFSPGCDPHISIIKRKFFDECVRLSRETRIGSRTIKWADLKVKQLDIQSEPIHEWKRFVYF